MRNTFSAGHPAVLSRDTPAESPGYRALRRGRCSLPGQAYLLTTVTRKRHLYVANPQLAMIACRTIAMRSTWPNAELLAWILMPDHWHGLLVLRDESLSSAMNRFKAVMTQAMCRQAFLAGSLWSRGFHDHALRAEEDIRRVARYIITNPVRAGIVESVSEYPY